MNSALENAIEEAISSRVDALHNDDDAEQVVAELSRLVQAPVLVLCEIVNSKSHKVRKGIVRILGRVATRQAIPTLASLLSNDDDKMVRHAAMRALAQIGGVEVLDIIEGTEVDDNTELLRIRSETAATVRAGLANQFAGEPDPGPEAENTQTDLSFEFRQSINSLAEYSLNDLTLERVRSLVVDELQSRLRTNRIGLIHRVSRMFGRNYLIRVRQYVNRSIFPMAERGRIRLDGDLIEWLG